MFTRRRPSRKSAAVSKSRWLAYATAGAATTIGAVNTADADITYSGPINQPYNGNQSGFTLQPGAAIYLGHVTAQAFAGFFINASVSAMFRGASAGNYRYPSRLGSGINVSIGNFVANRPGFFATLASGGAYGNFRAPGEGFVGIKFNSGAGVQYGWVRLNMNGSDNGNTFTLVDYAYGSPGEMIATGQVPEPGSLALLALGAAGLVVWRKRRSQAA